MIKTILLVFSLLAFSATAQESSNTAQNLFSVNFLLPGLEYETGLSNKTTLDLRLGSGFALNGGTGRETRFGIYPNFHAQYRFFYNFDRRFEKGKNTANNSANYIAFSTGIYSGKPIFGELEYNQDYMAEIGPVWGIQRVYRRGFKLDLHLGAGMGFNDAGDTFVSPLVSFRLGWLLANF